MLKKILIGTATLGLVSFFLFGTSAVSHVKQGASWIRSQVEESVPPEYELERARALIEEMGPQIRECASTIATKEVELRYLKDDIAKLESESANLRGMLEIQATALKSNQSHYIVGAKRVTHSRYAVDAQRRLDRAKRVEKVLSSKRALMENLESALATSRNQLEEIKTQRELARNRCAEIEAQLKEVKARKSMTFDPDLDDSKLTQAKDILRQIQMRIDVDQQLLENEAPLLEETPLDLGSVDTADQITAFLDPAQLEREVMALTEQPSTSADATANR